MHDKQHASKHGRVARGAVTAALVAALVPAGILAGTTPSKADASYDLATIKNGTYAGTAQVTDQDEGAEDEFESYTLTASVTVADHKITSVNVTGEVPEASRTYLGYATNGRTRQGTTYAGVPAQVVDRQSTNIDTVSGATVSSNAIKVAVDNALANADTESEVTYVYGYSGLTWAEYYANEPVDNADNASSNPQLDSHGETDLGGFDVVTRATTNHGLHRGSYQCTAVIETDTGNTYNLASWNSRTEFVDTEGKTHSYVNGVIDDTNKVTGYEVQGLKYVPVAVRSDQLDAYRAKHTFIENGSTLAGGFSENSIQSYTAIADVDENTNGLKVATVAEDGTVSYSPAKRDGTTSGLEGQELQTIDLSTLNPTLRSTSGSTQVGSYGESIRLDMAGAGYGALGAKLQSVTWEYYGSTDPSANPDATPEATYGTKFAADNWMHRQNGIQLGLSDSYRSPISSLTNGGVGYWKITTHALGYADASYTFQVTEDNIAVHTLATDEDKDALQALVDQADALTEQDYTTDTWVTLATELQETKDLLAKDTLYQSEATEQQGHLQSALDGLEKRSVTSWRDDYAAVAPTVDTTSSEYDVVTSATTFTSHHASDIAGIVSKATDDAGTTTGLDGVKLSGKEATVTPKVSSTSYSNSCSYGDGEFIIVPDDTVEGYTWNDFYNNAYAVTVSDGTTTVAALPWQDWYGENATSGYHYNKFEVALNNGTSKGTNEGQISRYAAFYDEDGNVKAGSYTVTIYSEGYEPLVASDITVLPTYTGEVTASETSASSPQTTISGLDGVENPKVTVSYTTGHGRSAKTTYYAQDAEVGSDGTVALDYDALAQAEVGTQLNVTITSDNYEPIYVTATVAQPAVRFIDVTSTTSHEADINWMADTGISTGWKLSDGTREYRPNAYVARGDMAAFLHRLAGDGQASLSDVVFADVTATTSHYADINWMAQSGISTGWRLSDGTREYRPNAYVARGDMAAFLYRLAGSPEFDVSEAAGFSDVSTTTSHYKEILWMQVSGVSTGWANADGTSSYRPNAYVARGDMAAFLHRMAQKGLVGSTD